METKLDRSRAVLEKMVTKAIQSERLAVVNYRRIASLTEDPTAVARARQDEAEEARHAVALQRAARRDGLQPTPADTFDYDLDGVREAFERVAATGDRAACLFIQDVFLEAVAIDFYESLSAGARASGAVVLAALLKTIIADERGHLASGLREILHELPDRGAREAAFVRAGVAILPIMLKFADSEADAPCARTCGSCRDQCLKVDACAAEIPLAGGWTRIVATIEDAARRVGLGASLPRAA